jgi:hypothetical protein
MVLSSTSIFLLNPQVESFISVINLLPRNGILKIAIKKLRSATIGERKGKGIHKKGGRKGIDKKEE